MSDEDEPLVETSPSDNFAFLYDYMKHIVSLSLITLGGILTIAQMDETDDLKPVNIVAAIVLVGMGGAAAFTCTSEIAISRYAHEPLSRSFEFARKIAPICFLLGVGYALAMFVDVMV